MKPQLQSLRLRSSLSDLRHLTEFVDRFCAEANVPDTDRIALQVCLQEVATNVIIHGYQKAPDQSFVVSLQVDENSLSATVVDDAPPFDPIARPEVDIHAPDKDRPIGGLGVHLIKHFGDPHYERRENQNALTITRPITRA